MSEYTAHPTQPGNTHELTSPGTLNYDITRSGSTRRWDTEPQMKSSGNGSNNTEQRRNPKIPCPEISGLLTRTALHAVRAIADGPTTHGPTRSVTELLDILVRRYGFDD